MKYSLLLTVAATLAYAMPQSPSSVQTLQQRDDTDNHEHGHHSPEERAQHYCGEAKHKRNATDDACKQAFIDCHNQWKSEHPDEQPPKDDNERHQRHEARKQERETCITGKIGAPVNPQ